MYWYIFPVFFSLSNRMFNFDLLVFMCPGNKSFCLGLPAGLILDTLLRGEAAMACGPLEVGRRD